MKYYNFFIDDNIVFLRDIVQHNYSHLLELFCNQLNCSQITQRLTDAIKANKKYLNIGTHEQYFYQDYHNYLPDHFERLETTLGILKNSGYKPLFFNLNEDLSISKHYNGSH